MCLKIVGQLLDFRSQNFPEKQRVLDACVITMISNICGFMSRYFTKIDGAIIGGPESTSVTDIYGVVFHSKIEENIINEDEDWKRYREDSFSISL